MNIKKHYQIAKFKLFNICRSITGNGITLSLQIIKKQFPNLKIKKIRCGKKVFDWKIPPEWNVYDAYVLDHKKKKIIDFKKNNLHLVNFSVPVKKRLKKSELLKKIFTLKKQPKAIPYVTSYYKKNWGFCVSHEFKKNVLEKYEENSFFDMKIDTKLNHKGNLRYGEYFIKGKKDKEILISTYLCHPSMANNELSGPIVTMSLIDYFKRKKINYGLRFVIIPETIGAISYIHKNLKKLTKNVFCGFNITCVGDSRNYTFIKSKYENSPSDYSIEDVLKNKKLKYTKLNFLKRGSDERQYNSVGVNLGITTFSRSKFDEFPEYHTSLDNFDFVSIKSLTQSFNVIKDSIELIQSSIYPKTQIVCEPFLTKRNFYPEINIKGRKFKDKTKLILDFLQYSDGNFDLKKISKKIKCKYSETKDIYKYLLKIKLVS
tara:strand:+ start:2829 stop:4121 length:1293 start_codon:yes stop_codon:yes gene_type:complete